MNHSRTYKSFEELEEHLTSFVKEQGYENFQVIIWFKKRPRIQINLVFYNLHSSPEDLWNLDESLQEEYPLNYLWKFSVECSNRRQGKLRMYNEMENPLYETTNTNS